MDASAQIRSLMIITLHQRIASVCCVTIWCSITGEARETRVHVYFRIQMNDPKLKK